MVAVTCTPMGCKYSCWSGKLWNKITLFIALAANLTVSHDQGRPE